MNLKGVYVNWKYILLVLSLAIVAGGGIFATQYFWPEQEVVIPAVTPADQKTYRNEEYGFEIKYPAGPDKDVRINTMTSYTGFCNLGYAVVSIEVYPMGMQPNRYEFNGDSFLAVNIKGNDGDQSFDEWITGNCNNDWPSDAKRESIKVAGIDAVKLIGNRIEIGRAEDQPLVIFRKGDLLYFLHPYGDKTISDKMLSSFRFFK